MDAMRLVQLSRGDGCIARVFGYLSSLFLELGRHLIQLNTET
jgi:hypothetical protein